MALRPPLLLLLLLLQQLLPIISFWLLVLGNALSPFVHAAHQDQSSKASAFTDCSNTARFPAMFGFGTSLSDTGNGILSSPLLVSAARPPYGCTFFAHPTGRFSDGRNMIDFVAEAIGVPYLNPYLKKTVKDTDFSRGVNYAVAGATVQTIRELLRQADLNVLTADSLDVQTQWHLSIKQAAQQAPSSPPLIPDVVLPRSASFSKALYFIEFGGNDYGIAFVRKHLLTILNKQPINNSYILNHVVPEVIGKMVDAIEILPNLILMFSKIPRNMVLKRAYLRVVGQVHESVINFPSPTFVALAPSGVKIHQAMSYGMAFIILMLYITMPLAQLPQGKI